MWWISCIAHPDTLELYDDKLYNEIKLLVDNRLNGIEVINGQMNNLRFDEYHQLANHFDLFETVGSDFHSTSRHNIGICVDDNLCNNFCKILKKVRSDFMALKRGTVQLEKYNSIWKKSYMEEEKLLKEILNDYIIEIHHVGSTSIEGLMAKPVVDILIVIESLDLIPEIENILMNYNYDNRGPQGVPDRMFFAKGSEDARTHYIHFTTPKSNTYYDLIYFKRYLLDNPDYILKYCKLKQELALKYSNERSKYTQGKSDFIKEVISLAKEEYND